MALHNKKNKENILFEGLPKAQIPQNKSDSSSVYAQIKDELAPFVSDIFIGMLCLYMLDMGILTAEKFGALRKPGLFLITFALSFSLLGGIIGVCSSYVLNLTEWNALLLTVLTASASYIAVPSAMKAAIKEVNISLMLPMTLGITFIFNISVGIPLYDIIIKNII